ncbi:uncharacterized protein LOC128731939 [Anopheles nili]|uniref:uncharacterized protein LOC128731939 n=1 Tax=Anopheles nili TaxID=185578 RepID=UPI00237B2709|nr:uncharacterized protein LOC128731939 [Anopheles nili]
MCVHGNLIVPFVLATVVVWLGHALSESTSGPASSQRVVAKPEPWTAITSIQVTRIPEAPKDDGDRAARSRSRRRTRDQDDKSNIESSISLWEWLKGREKPEDNCMLMAIGGVASGGALTGAFVGAGIGSIFTGPGVIVGGIIGGLVGVFGGLSVGARAGAVACENV